MVSTYQIVVHEYNDSATGHVNIEFRIDGVTQGWYGANFNGIDFTEPGLSGGIFDQALAESNVTFDITGDGIAEKTGWLSKEDGFLALFYSDLNVSITGIVAQPPQDLVLAA